MAYESINISHETWDTSTNKYKIGKRQLEEWHEKCRRKRIEEAIEKKKREIAIKHIRDYQDAMIQRAYEKTRKNRGKKTHNQD